MGFGVGINQAETFYFSVFFDFCPHCMPAVGSLIVWIRPVFDGLLDQNILTIGAHPTTVPPFKQGTTDGILMLSHSHQVHLSALVLIEVGPLTLLDDVIKFGCLRHNTLVEVLVLLVFLDCELVAPELIARCRLAWGSQSK